MEVEVKVRLGSAADHGRVVELFQGVGQALGVHEQTNHFLDGTDGAL